MQSTQKITWVFLDIFFYAPLVEFLFLTGCRPSESLALMWKTVGQTQIKFEQALV